MPIALLFTTATATAVSGAALYAVHGLRKQIAALHTEVVAHSAATRPHVPAARSTGDGEAIRTAVAEALAEEREREMAEARAFWAAQETRDASDAPSILGLPGDELYLPRQSDFLGLAGQDASEFAELSELQDLQKLDGIEGAADAADAERLGAFGFLEPVAEHAESAEEEGAESAELAAARRRHPSHPDFVPHPSGAPGGDHERTVNCLEDLARSGTALADVRPGPLGTLDVYVFEDGTTLCMTPGHRETAQQLAEAVRGGEAPVLVGGSGVSGAYALTFSFGTRNVYILADRVIASP
ncbi:hypothetical protein [Streptomyces sp. NPDC058045]|uniref:hypothetical protein n=1 Tax=Streptomyces sp. NPDC058045 TaxID=3346311 RepID=UPI0036EB685D